jgi:hypothetical protein
MSNRKSKFGNQKSGEVLVAGALIGLLCGLIGLWVDASGRAQAKANLSGMEVSVSSRKSRKNPAGPPSGPWAAPGRVRASGPWWTGFRREQGQGQ